MPTRISRGAFVIPIDSTTRSAPESPAGEGFRWPAEWEAHEATWLSWPHNRETWPRQLAAVERAFVAMARALCGREKVCITVQDSAMADSVHATLIREGMDPGANVGCYVVPTNDAWIRDHGPVFLVRDSGMTRERAVMDFGYNAWGGKYPPWDCDEKVSRRMAGLLGLQRFANPAVIEAGSIEGNGQGTLITTDSCLLNSNRGPGRTRDFLESMLRASLGVEHVLWLDSEIVGDDTDGHVDNLARFVASDVVVTVVEEDAHDPNYEPLRKNLARLRAAGEDSGRKLSIATLPMPPPVFVGGMRCPASYANFYIANEVVLLPTFGTPSDARAIAILEELLPGRDVVGIPARDLVVGLGSVHCLTQQEPSRETQGAL